MQDTRCHAHCYRDDRKIVDINTYQCMCVCSPEASSDYRTVTRAHRVALASRACTDHRPPTPTPTPIHRVTRGGVGARPASPHPAPRRTLPQPHLRRPAPSAPHPHRFSSRILNPLAIPARPTPHAYYHRHHTLVSPAVVSNKFVLQPAPPLNKSPHLSSRVIFFYHPRR